MGIAKERMKKMKKRTVSLVLALLMLLSMLAACGGDPVAQTASSTEPTPPDRPLSLGVVSGNTYTNTYAGLGCTLDEDWVILPAEELQELPEILKAAMEDTELGEAMKDVKQFTDMYAESTSGLTNMNILFQKLTLKERLAYMVMTEEELVDQVLGQKDAMIDAYAAAGIQVKSMEKVSVTFLGEPHFALLTMAETNEVPHFILQLFDYHKGEYSVTLTLTSFMEDHTKTMLKLFYPLS